MTVTRRAYKVIDEMRLVYAFQNQSEESPQIFTARLDGSDPIQLTFDTRYGLRFPSLSADGKQIACVGISASFGYAIFIMDSNGENRRIVLAEPSTIYEQPVWSPDGKHLAYAARGRGRDDRFNLYLYDLSQEVEQSETAGFQLTENISPDKNWVESRYVAWLNEKELVYSRRTPGRRELYKLNIETLESMPFVNAGRTAIQPAISQDRKQIAYVSLDVQTSLPSILVGDIVGSSSRLVSQASSNLSMPTWGLDNRGLFAMDAIGQPSIWWVPLDGSSLQKLNLGTGFAYDPSRG